MIKLSNLPIDSLNLSAITGTALYGLRKNPVTGSQQIHHGVDLNRLTTGAAINKQAVKAVASGSVIISKLQGDGKGYGNYIVINHGSWYSLYAHLSDRSVKSGEKVQAGQIIGAVGSTGNSTGPHLHFGISTSYSASNPDKESKWVNPLSYLKAAEKAGNSPEGSDGGAGAGSSGAGSLGAGVDTGSGTEGLETNGGTDAVIGSEQEDIKRGEGQMKVYESVAELTGDWKTAVEWAVDKGIIKGNGKTLGMTESEVKALVFIYRDNLRRKTV